MNSLTTIELLDKLNAYVFYAIIINILLMKRKNIYCDKKQIGSLRFEVKPIKKLTEKYLQNYKLLKYLFED